MNDINIGLSTGISRIETHSLCPRGFARGPDLSHGSSGVWISVL